MTVRAWFTISALCLLALGVAIGVRFFSPIQPPELIVTGPDERLEGVQHSFCWPQRDGEPRCGGSGDAPQEPGPSLPGSGSMRIVAAYPVQPTEGSVRILRAGSGDGVLFEPWTDRLQYELEPGAYELIVEARYQPGAFVRYLFGFQVGGSGG